MKAKIAITFLSLLTFLSCHDNYEHKTVICIPVYGQSLALGIDAERITDFDTLANYAEGRIVTECLDHKFGYYNVNPLKQSAKKLLHNQKNSFEISSYSMAQWLSDNTGEDTIICIFPGGQDGTIISELGKGSKPYKKLLIDIKTAFKTAKERKWDFELPAICWMQGETDVNSYPKTNYKELISQFAKDLNNDVKQITFQNKDVEIICYQTNSLTRAEYFKPTKYKCVETEVAQAQMEQIRDNPKFHASGPTYPYDCVNEIIHIDGVGQRQLGILAALSANDILKHKNNVCGLLPQKVSSHGSEVTLYFNIPHPPLKLDTTLVAKADNYGFSVITSDNRNIAQQVHLNEDVITILCSESAKDCKVRYAVNGDYMKSGRKHGPRGNLRDSMGDSLFTIIKGKEYAIHNWCYQFDILIE